MKPRGRIEYNGRMVTFVELAEIVGIKASTLARRYREHGFRGARLVAPVHHTCKMESVQAHRAAWHAKKVKKERLQQLAQEHAQLFARPLGVYPLTQKERREIEERVNYSGQLSWNAGKWYGVDL